MVDGTDTIDPPKTLDDAHRIPVDVIIDQGVAILEVLPFRDTVSSYQDIDLRSFFISAFLRPRRKIDQQVVETGINFQGTFIVIRSSYLCAFKPIGIFAVSRDIIIQVVNRIGECAEN
ncbi:hypothetical protein SDC9_127407 [bioreactor metagenome]|uniref:Uncharacterized protein n=1 Tax=bioreactor metagenome TaxID=1076179 RepID=A0A645CTC5_9ZZZZ